MLKIYFFVAFFFTTIFSFGQTSDLISDLKKHKLPIFEIILNTQDQITSKDEYTTATFIIHTFNNNTYSSETIQTEIKGRGNSTWNWPKKPFRLKLASSKKLLGMPSSRHWALLANFADKTLLRNKLASSVSKYFGLKYSPRSEMVELVMNGWHWGTYEVIEVPKIATDRVDITSIKTTNNVVSGGVIFELDERRGEQYNFQTSIANQVFTVKDPDDLNTTVPEIAQARLDYCINILQTAENALYSDNFKDVTTGYQKYFNTQSVIDWYLTEELFKNIDLSRYSVYMYIDTKNNNKITFGPTWDFDLSSGLLEDYSGIRGTENAWISRFYEDENFRKLIKDRWTSKRNDLLYFINNRLNTDSRNIFVGQQKNFNFWNNFYGVITSEYPSFHQESNFENDIFYLKSWLRNRIVFLDAQFSDNLMHIKPISKDSSLNTLEDEIITSKFSSESKFSNNSKYIISKAPKQGQIKNLNSVTGSYQYIPEKNYVGVDSIFYSFFDGIANSDTAIIRININPINDTPVTVSYTNIIDEDNTLTRTASNGLKSHSSDVENDNLTFQLVTNTKNGALLLNSDGSFNYTPTKDYFGTDTFYFKAYDGQLYSNISYYAININPLNDAPVIFDSTSFYQLFRNQQIKKDFTKYLSDVDDPINKLILKETMMNSKGSISFFEDRTLIYTPDRSYIGLDSIAFSVSDGKLLSVAKSIKIRILNDYASLENNNIKLYPNPSNGHFIIKDLLIDEIKIYDMNGNRILNFTYSKVGSSIEVKINNLINGIYLIQLSYENKLIGFKNIIITN